jgi:nucleotide-binding universal stress UspA family protein
MLTTSWRASRADGTEITRLTDDQTGDRRDCSLVGHEIDWTRPGPGADGPDSSTTRILFPYSGSPTDEAALDVAAEWAVALRASAWVLYVRPWDTSRGGHYFVETRAEARAVTTEAVVRLRARGVSASGVVRSADRGRIAHAILAEADALDVRMIVLGTRARGVLGAALLGSTSRTVARRAARPVVLVKARVPPTFATRRQPLDT